MIIAERTLRSSKQALWTPSWKECFSVKKRKLGWAYPLVGIGVILASCAGFKEWRGHAASPEEIEPYTTTQFGDEPEVTFARFSILGEALTGKESPYLADSQGVPFEKNCFTKAELHPVWQTENHEIIQKLSEQEADVEKSILAWAREAFLPEYITGEMELRVKYEGVVVNHTPLSALRLSPQGGCVDDETGSFPADSRVITTLFGTKTISFKSEEPLEVKDVKAIRTAAETAGFQLDVVRFDYPKALGPDGERLKDEKDRPLFWGPSGEKLNWAQLPKGRDGPVVAWSLALDTPLYFAVGDVRPGAWSSEVKPDTCSLNLTFSEKAPRVPECTELRDAGFGVEQSTLFDSVTVKVTADGVTEVRQVPFGKRKAIQVAGRVIVWVTPKALEDGVHLSIDSFVIEPRSAAPEDLAQWPDSTDPKPQN